MLVSVAASVSVANAADLAVKAPVYKAPPIIVSNWSGFYIGLNGGGGWGKNTFDVASPSPNFAEHRNRGCAASDSSDSAIPKNLSV